MTLFRRNSSTKVLQKFWLSKKVNSSLKCKTKCKFEVILEYISREKKHLNHKNKSRKFVCARLNSTFIVALSYLKYYFLLLIKHGFSIILSGWTLEIFSFFKISTPKYILAIS